MCLYLSNTASNSANVENFCNILYNYNCVNFPVFIVGDFNMPTIDWSIPATSAGKNQQVFLKFCTDNALKQLISEPTRCNGNILDLLLCNTINNKYLNSHCVDAPMSNSCDHYFIHFSLIWPFTQNKSVTKMPNFRRANYELISNMLSIVDWEHIIDKNKDNIQTLYNHIIDKLSKMIYDYVPSKSKSHKIKKPQNIAVVLKEKLQLYRECKRNPQLTPAYKTKSKQYDQLVKQWCNQMELSLYCNPTPSKFYGYVNKKLNSRSFIPPLLTDKGNLISSDKRKADLLNTFFHSVFTQDDGHALKLNCKVTRPQFMKDVIVTEADVAKSIQKLNNSLSRTPENIPAYFLKKLLFHYYMFQLICTIFVYLKAICLISGN